jgi:hypothetical protein
LLSIFAYDNLRLQGGAMMRLRNGAARPALLAAWLWAVWGPAFQARGQVLYGSLVGTVTDPSGALVPAAEVKITNRATNQTRTALTNEAGLYSFSNVLAGPYDMEVKAAGFRVLRRTGLEVVVNTVRREDVQLQVGQITDAITVTGGAVALQTERADVTTEIRSDAVTNLPIGGYRNYQSLINLVAGATPAQFQNAAISRPGRALTTNINGTNRNNNVTKLDGAVNMSVWLPHHVAYVAPTETIETVNVATNNFDPEQGMAGGAAITVVTKSGTNQLHGSVFAYHENQHLRARNFFERLPQKPKSIRNIDGFTLGGPIRRDKLFFFGGWESSRERVSRSGLFTLPLESLRRGDFSGYATTIYDPATGAEDGKGREPFPGNLIPLARQSAITRKIQALIPLPNQPGISANFYNSDVQQLDRDQADVKINWNRTASHTLWAKYSLMNAPASCQPAFGAAGGPGLCDVGSGKGDNRAQLATLGHTWVVGPALVIDGVLGYTRNRINVTPPLYGKNIGLETFGIPGTNGSDIRQSGMPTISISGYSPLGDTDSWNPAFQRDQTYTGSTNVGWARGTHDVRFGLEITRHQMNHWQPELGSGPRGGLTFGIGPTVLNGGPAGNLYNGYATFLLGLVTEAGKSVQWETMTTREWQYGFYLRDRWHIARRTTAVLGLRYEFFPLVRRAHTGIELWDPQSNIVSRGGLGGNPMNLGISTSRRLFAPRLGLTHRLTENTVLRTGFGITFNPMVLSRPLRGSYPMTIDASFPAVNSYQWFGPVENGIPLFSGEDPRAGAFPLPIRFSIRTLWRPDGRRKVDRGYIESWNFILERKLPGDFVLTAGYVATHTIRSFVDWEANNSPPGTGLAGAPFYQRFGRSASTLLFNGWADANYHSFQATFNRALRNGLMVKGAYTWSAAINMQDDDGWGGVPWNWAPAMRRNRARAGYDIPHNLHLGFVYELPFGKGKKIASQGWSSWLLGGWQANGIFYAYQGRPFTVSAPGTSLNSRYNAQTADQVKPEVTKLGGVGPGNFFYDPTAFAAVREVRFGTTGRNILRAPGVVGLDAGLFKQFRLRESLKVEFRAEAFNLTNTPRFGTPSSDVSSPTFMQILGAGGERQLRFGLRLQF